MGTIQVQPAEVQAAGQTVRGAGTTVDPAVGGLSNPGISDGFTTSEAIGQLCAQWSAGLQAFATACNSVAASLSHAGTVYQMTESHLGHSFAR